MKAWGTVVLQISSGLAARTGRRGGFVTVLACCRYVALFGVFFVYRIILAEMTPSMNHIICHLHGLGERFSSILARLHSAASVEVVACSPFALSAALWLQPVEVQFRGFLEALVAMGSTFFS